jgi:hypothetical protein
MSRIIVLPLIALLAAATARAETPTALAAGLRLQPVGAGEMRFFGFHLYDISLWTETGRFEGFRDGQTVALHIHYRKPISRDRLVATTRSEWDRLGRPGGARHQQWLATVEDIWPDVAPGDVITTVVSPDGSTRFYSRRGLLGEIRDSGFGPAFLAIWLDPDTRARDVRASLLGLSGEL